MFTAQIEVDHHIVIPDDTVNQVKVRLCVTTEQSSRLGTYTMGNSITRGRERREKEAIERVEQLKYHDSMVLERTDDDITDWQRYLEGEIRVHRERMEVRYFNANSVSLQGNGTCVRPKVQSGASYITSKLRRSYVFGTLKRIAGYGLDSAQMQKCAGRHMIMELKAAGWVSLGCRTAHY